MLVLAIIASMRCLANKEWQGHGLFWEADSVARCLARGEKENSLCPLSETIEVMKAIDKMREIGGLRYPEAIEATD